MRGWMIWLATICLVACGVTKKRHTFFKQESGSEFVDRRQLKYQQQIRSMLQEGKAKEQKIEIWSAAPYSWHPDSGIKATGGYLHVQLSEQQKRNYETVQKHKEEMATDTEEKITTRTIQRNRQKEQIKPAIWLIIAIFCCFTVVIVAKRAVR